MRKIGILGTGWVAAYHVQALKKLDIEVSAESILKQSGYSVGASEDLTDEQRRQVLVCLMESDICSRQKITSHLSWLIQSREGRYDMFNAVCKWRADREFVDAYKMGTGRVVAMRALRVSR